MANNEPTRVLYVPRNWTILEAVDTEAQYIWTDFDDIGIDVDVNWKFTARDQSVEFTVVARDKSKQHEIDTTNEDGWHYGIQRTLEDKYRREGR